MPEKCEIGLLNGCRDKEDDANQGEVMTTFKEEGFINITYMWVF